MNSSRLPGKVLMQVKNKALLLYMHERVIASTEIDEVIIATSSKKSDKELVRFCELNQMMYFCGSLDDVLDRYYQAAKNTNADVIVRLTADCPIIDPSIIDAIVKVYKNGTYDYVANTAPPDGASYPEGMDVEVFSMTSLRNAWINAKKPSEREHVTFYFWKNIKLFNCFRVNLAYDLSRYRLTVDYYEDFLLVRKILEDIYIEGQIFSLSDVIKFLDNNLEIYKINNKIEPNAGWQASLNKDLKNE